MFTVEKHFFCYKIIKKNAIVLLTCFQQLRLSTGRNAGNWSKKGKLTYNLYSQLLLSQVFHVIDPDGGGIKPKKKKKNINKQLVIHQYLTIVIKCLKTGYSVLSSNRFHCCNYYQIPTYSQIILQIFFFNLLKALLGSVPQKNLKK